MGCPHREAVAHADGTARLWDVSSGRQHQVFSEPTGEAINDAWFSPSGTQIVTASDDGTARIWSAATGTVLQTLNGPGGNPVYNAAFSRDGKLVVTCSGSAAVIWNTSTGQQITQLWGIHLTGLDSSHDDTSRGRALPEIDRRVPFLVRH